MKLFTFLLIALASFTMAAPSALRETKQVGKEEFRKLGPLNDGEEVTINREYNEDGEPPAGRQVQVSPDHPADEPEGSETLKRPSEDEHDENGERKLYYNCYSYCWWNWYYGYITKCCPWWGCAYYYC